MKLTAQDLQVGQIYRAKKPRRSNCVVNDRQIIWMDSFRTQIQYDGPAVSRGSPYPRMHMAKFLEWVSHNVTEETPPGEWAPWPPTKEAS